MQISCLGYFTIQRKFHFILVLMIKFLMTKETTLFYTGKIERCLIIRITEHDTKETERVFKHLSECEMFKEYY